MASESSDTSAPLPEDLSSWLDDRAGELGVESDELLRQLVAAYRVQTDAEGPHVPSSGDLAALEDDVEGKLDDVRRRVVQIKQQVDAKADADHSHRELEALSDVEERLAALEERVDGVATAAADTDERVDAAADRLDDHREKLTRVASAVVGLQRGGSESALVRIKQTAAREGYGRAVCDACGEAVHVGLLGAATCPHCATDIHDVEPGGGWFRKPRLVGEDADE